MKKCTHIKITKLYNADRTPVDYSCGLCGIGTVLMSPILTEDDIKHLIHSMTFNGDTICPDCRRIVKELKRILKGK